MRLAAPDDLSSHASAQKTPISGRSREIRVPRNRCIGLHVGPLVPIPVNLKYVFSEPSTAMVGTIQGEIRPLTLRPLIRDNLNYRPVASQENVAEVSTAFD